MLQSKTQELPSVLSELSAMQYKIQLLMEEEGMETLEQESEKFQVKYKADSF